MNLVQDGPAATQKDAPRRSWPAVLGWTAAGILAVALAVVILAERKPVTGIVTPAPVVRFQIDRPNTDPYNNAASAFAVSPDGKFLAHYLANSNGRATLAVRTLATGESREVPGSAVQSPRAPFWSPDSKQVAYVTTGASYTFAVATATTRELCRCSFRGGSWNRDGLILIGSAAEPAPIRRLSLEESAPVAVTKVDSTTGETDTWPVFLPDGRRFLFTRSKPGSAQVTYLGSLDEDEPKRISEGSRRDFISPLNGLGPYLLGIDAAGLVAQPIELSTMGAAGEPIIVLPGVIAASISGNGILAASALGRRPVTVPKWFDRKGTELGTFGPAGSFQSVNLTPDGRTVAVADTRTGGAEIWVRDVAGANKRLTFGTGARDNAPAWSPDGRRIIVSS